MKYNYGTEEISISKEELDTAFSDIEKFSILLDDITFLWLTEACGFTKREAKRFIKMDNRMGNRKEKRKTR